MRFLLLLSLCFFVQISSFAQIDSEALKKEMEQLTEELQDQMKNFNFEGFQFDTLLLKNFKFPEGLGGENFVSPDNIDMNEMLKMMERQMNQLDLEGLTKIMEQQMGRLDIEGMTKMMEENFNKMDFEELEKMLEPFMEGEFLTIPNPEDLENKEKKGEKVEPKKEKKKQHKKKSYKM